MKALEILRFLERTFIVSLFLTMVTLFVWNVIAREIGGTFASKFAWIEEAVRYMNSFLVFMTLGLALEQGRHVGIDTIRNKLTGMSQKIVLKAIDFSGFIFSLTLSWLGYGLVKFVLMTGQRSPTLDVSVGYLYLAPVVGFGLLALRFALSFFGIVDRFSIDEASAEEPA